MRPCIFVVGTRAQLVKIAPVLHTASNLGLAHRVWFSGQHRESIEDLIVDFRLQSEIVTPSSWREHSDVGGLLKWLPSAFHACYTFIRSSYRRSLGRPLVVVHGDTLSTLLGALAGRLAGGEVVHLESGLSSGRLTDPFPEEILRRLTFRLSRYALCPNREAAERMRRFGKCEVVDTRENTLLDCVRFALGGRDELTDCAADEYFVASIHRFGNIYRKGELSGILDEMIQISSLGMLYFVLHPPTERRLRQLGLFDKLVATPGICVKPRMPFTQFLALLAGARGVFSDGGSNQEELSYLGVPTVLYRDRSERPDGLGANIIFRKYIDGPLPEYIASGRLDKLRRPSRMNEEAQPSRMVVQALLAWAANPQSRSRAF